MYTWYQKDQSMEGEGLRTKSFRDEDYNTRRVFLRSYPLQWGSPEDYQQNQENQTNPTNKAAAAAAVDDQKKKKDKITKQKEAIKKIMVTVVEWGGGRAVVLRRMKDKVTLYVITCFPVAFKPPKAFISAMRVG